MKASILKLPLFTIILTPFVLLSCLQNENNITGLNDKVSRFEIPLVRECPETSATGNPIKVLYPNGGEHFEIGDTVSFTFCTSEADLEQILGSISVDGGEEWIALTDLGAVLNSIGNSYTMVIPDSARSQSYQLFSLESKQTLVRFHVYNQEDLFDVSDSLFIITAL